MAFSSSILQECFLENTWKIISWRFFKNLTSSLLGEINFLKSLQEMFLQVNFTLVSSKKPSQVFSKKTPPEESPRKFYFKNLNCKFLEVCFKNFLEDSSRKIFLGVYSKNETWAYCVVCSVLLRVCSKAKWNRYIWKSFYRHNFKEKKNKKKNVKTLLFV